MGPSTLVDVIRSRRDRADRTAIVSLDGDAERERISFAELDQRACAVAAHLRELAPPGSRALLVYGWGPPFVAAFLGCLYAGVIAVPVYPPNPRRLGLDHLARVVRDAGVEVVLGTTEVEAALRGLGPEWAGLRVLATDRLAPSAVDLPAPRPHDVAFLQYTSGSTSAPRGVVVTHQNLLDNQHAIQAAFGHGPDEVIVSWLPLYHDMGLIGGVLQPLFLGATCVLMSPLDFLSRPMRWLEAVDRYRGTTSGGPNFAFDLAVRRSEPAARAALDLRSWRVAFDGAEPVRASTLAAFAEAFRPAGFDGRALLPCYGLAEATLLVAAGGAGRGPSVAAVGGRPVVGCGHPWLDHQVRIADAAGRALPDGDVGEIWVSGRSVAQGYWGQAQATAETFGAFLSDGTGPYLRTGDLGFLRAGELFVTGRAKDLLIVRGRNLYPQDVEATAERCHPAVRLGGVATFAVGPDHDRVVVVAEVRDGVDPSGAALAVRRAVAEEHELDLHEVVLIVSGTLLKTSSGKVRRRACRDAFEAGALSVVARDTVEPAAVEPGTGVEAVIARVLGRAVGPDVPLTEGGLDSLAAVELCSELGGRVSVQRLFEGPTPRELAAEVGPPAAAPASSPDDHAPVPLTAGQRAVWVADRLADGVPYTLAVALRLEGPLDAEQLAARVAALCHRHPSLRTVVREVDGEPLQTFDGQPSLVRVSGAGWSDEARSEWLDGLQRHRFDLRCGTGPLTRFELVHLGEGRHLLGVAAHHLAMDLWSAALCLRELAGDVPTATAPHPHRRVEQVRAHLAGPDGDAARAFWIDALRGAAGTSLVAARGSRSGRGQRWRRSLGPERAQRIRQLAAELGVTPYLVLLTTFQVWLHRWTGVDDVVIGTPSAGRRLPGMSSFVGYCTSPVAMRVDLSGNPRFDEALERSARHARSALAHDPLPLAELPDPPELSTFFALQSAPRRLGEEVVAAVMGEAGPALAFGPVTAEGVPLDHPDVAFELSLLAVEVAGDLRLIFEVDRDRFSSEAVSRLGDAFVRVLDGVLRDPAVPIDAVPLLEPAELAELRAWGTGPELPPTVAPVHLRILAHAATRPDRVAIRAGRRSVSWGELGRAVRTTARALAAHGIGPGARVAIPAERSPELVVRILATLSVGAAWVPVDPSHPPARLAAMLDNADPDVVLGPLPHGATAFRALFADRGVAEVEALDGDGDPPAVAVDLDAPAYLLYTSGSTGRPKGVVCTHRGVAALLDAFDLHGSLGPEDCGSLWTSPSWDVSVYEVMSILAAGGTLALVPDEVRLDGPAFVRWLGEHGVTSAYVPPFLVRDVALAPPAGARRLLTGVEPIPEGLLTALATALPRAVILNGYGPTEATVVATVYRVPPGPARHDRTPIGRPLAGVTARVLDPHGAEVPRGQVGELVLGGVGVAAGYHRDPETTAARFEPDPLRPGARRYRTGDWARWSEDGELEFVGRRDGQVKLRGNRIELGEIEDALASFPGVGRAVAAVRHDPHARLVGYVAADPAILPGLWDHLRRRLPATFVPSALVALDQLPLGPTGKVDRGSLPAPSRTESRGATTPLEALVLEAWWGVLGTEAAGIDDGFYEAGGNSLLAVELAARLTRASGRLVPASWLLEGPTVAGLAQRLEREPAPQDPQVLRVPRDGPLRASFAQERIWLVQRSNPAGTALESAYTVASALRLRGPLALDVLRRALQGVLDRHEVLRTQFVEADGRLVQQVSPVVRVELPVDADEPVEPWLSAQATTPFAADEPLFRARVLALGPDDHVLFLATHHLVFDGAHDEFFRELAAGYRGEELPPPPQYADFAAWQRARATPERIGPMIEWFAAQLRDAEPLSLPTDRPRPSVPTFRGARRPVRWSPEVGAAVRSLARAGDTTSFVVIAAALTVVLSRWSGQRGVSLGTPVVHRPPGAVGPYVNPVVIRADLSDEPTFRSHLRALRGRVVGASARAELPFELLVEALRPPRDRSRNPLFQVMLAVQPDPWRHLALGPLRAEPLPVDTGAARFDLLFSVWEDGERLSGEVEYATDLFDPSTVDRLVAQVERVLCAAATDPDRPVAALPLLSAEEFERQVHRWNATATPIRSAALHHAFEAEAARSPERVALRTATRSVRYGELDRRADAVAALLRSRGVAPGDRVGVCLPRDVELVAGLFGVLKAGAAYVPLPPDLPPARVARMIERSGVRVVLTDLAGGSHLGALPGERVDIGDTGDGQTSQVMVSPDALAYVLFTSGSTGVPKGVCVQHRPAVNVLDWVNGRYGIGPGDELLFVTSIGFDLSVYDLFGVLGAGGSVRIASEREVGDPAALRRILETEPITVWDSAPALLAAVMRAPAAGVGGSLREVLLSGDWIPVDLPDAVRGAFPTARIRALGGATEATIWSNHFDVGEVPPSWPSIPYGRPIDNARYYVLDEALQPCPIGVPGELWIGGDCLASGYAGSPEQTAERFVPDPFRAAPARMYRTGDRVRFADHLGGVALPEGTLVFMGRLDRQVKVRGFRVEAGEIEAALLRHPGVAGAVVVDRQHAGSTELLAYVVAPDDATEADLRAHLRHELPEYMVPSRIVPVEALPLGPTGKIDRARLPAPEPTARVVRAARDAVEAAVIEVWSAVLGAAEIGVEDDFFELGGHSIRAFEVVHAVRDRLGVDLPLRAVFEASTVAALAERIRTAGERAPPSEIETSDPVDLGALLDDLDNLLAEPDHHPTTETGT